VDVVAVLVEEVETEVLEVDVLAVVKVDVCEVVDVVEVDVGDVVAVVDTVGVDVVDVDVRVSGAVVGPGACEPVTGRCECLDRAGAFATLALAGR
jgi:hypothetical protein